MPTSNSGASEGRFRVSRRALVGFSGAAVAGFVPIRPETGGAGGDALANGNIAPATIELTLVASEFDWELLPGLIVRVWGYNQQFPGPEIRVREGDVVRITLDNQLTVPTTIHWHGLHVPPAMDGPAGLNQAAVEPGDRFLYEFVATPGGTRWYHSHADPHLQIPMGLYGPFIVEPRTPPRPWSWDREHTLVFGEWDLELTPDVAAGRAERGPRDQLLRGGELGADFFLINGRAHGMIPPLIVGEGELVLLRLINAGHQAHPIHLHGHSFKIVATDGNPVPIGMEWVKDTVLIGPSERYDLELEAVHPGVWMLHCHIEHHMANGMMTVIQYEGHVPTGPAADSFDDVFGGHDHSGHGEHSVSPLALPNVATDSLVPAPVADGSVEVRLIDNRFDPLEIEIEAGMSVTWVNAGYNTHDVMSSAAGFRSGVIKRGERYRHTFTEPGSYKIICRLHALAGMNSTVVVT